jgi:hypothetical protein
MEDSTKPEPSLPQVNNPEGLVDMLYRIAESPSNKDRLIADLNLKPRELGYRLAALRFFELIAKDDSPPYAWRITTKVLDSKSGINRDALEDALRQSILRWNSIALGLSARLQNTEYEIWEALSKGASKELSESTLGRRVTSYKKLIQWASRKEN